MEEFLEDVKNLQKKDTGKMGTMDLFIYLWV